MPSSIARPSVFLRSRRFFSVLLCALSAAATTSTATADDTSSRLVVLNRGDVDADVQLREKIDRVVLASLQGQVRVDSVYASPVPSEEVELAAGCTSRDVDCLQRIAATLEADWLMVRELVSNGKGGLFVTLVAHDGPDALVTRRAAAQVAVGTVGLVVPMLIERLYPSAVASPVQPKSDSSSRTPLAVVGWSATAVTAGLLATGAVMGTLSRRAQNEYVSQDISDKGDVDRAADLHARAEKRANIANGLFYASAGAGVIATGALLWNYLQPRDEVARAAREREHQAASVQLGMAPGPDGAALSIHGKWRGGL
jgi:hypothetical protein